MSVYLTFRPLLVQGMLVHSEATGNQQILIDNEQPEDEQVISVWHETIHLLFVAAGIDAPHDCKMIEEMAERIAKACPEIVPMLKKFQPGGKQQ